MTPHSKAGYGVSRLETVAFMPTTAVVLGDLHKGDRRAWRLGAPRRAVLGTIPTVRGLPVDIPEQNAQTPWRYLMTWI